MGQLTLKELDLKIDNLVEVVNDQAKIAGEGFVEVDRLIGKLREQQQQDIGDPEFDVIQGVIEALHGVRLQRAGEMAASLEAKYFPPEDVEEVEED